MSISRRGIFSAAALVFGVACFAVSGCTSYATPEQMYQLEQRQTDIKKTMNRAVNLKDEKAALEKRVADRKRAIEECAKLKQEATSNLTKIGK